MARITSGDVSAIIETDVSLSGFISTANTFVNNNLGSGLSADTLKQIELYICAHFVSITDPRETESEIGDARAKFEGKNQNGIGLNATQYGQMAIMFDTTGTLSNLGKKKTYFKVMSVDD